jgi:sulfite exporter TauE/SafE
MNTLTAFLTGLGTGGLTCLAVQGGLLVGLLAKRETDTEVSATRWQRLVLPVSGFLVAKILVYTVFGFLLGLIGQRLQLTTTALAWLQGAAALFMVVTGIRLIWPHWLPWLTITPPVAVRRFVRRSAKSELLVAPILLGALTIVIPCGTTLAMETAALATANAWQAASILLAFTLGTAPLFFLIGVLAKGTTFLQSRLKYVVAIFVVGVGLYSFNSMLNSIDSPYAWRNEVSALRWALTGTKATPTTAVNDHPTITVLATGYEPDALTVPVGKQVTLTLNAPGQLSCTSVFRIPKLRIERQLDPNSSTTVALTFPSAGEYTFTCGMGMYTGTFTAL